MKNFNQFILENEKYSSLGITINGVKDKIKYHRAQGDNLRNEMLKHNKTSKEYRNLKNDSTHHHNAANSYNKAYHRMKDNWGASYVKEKLKSAENHANKVSGIIPSVKKPPEKIKNIHLHVHKILTDAGFAHNAENHTETTHSVKRMTPYGDDRAFSQRGKRTNTIHTYTKNGSKQDAKAIEKTLNKDKVLGPRGSHYVSVYHKDDQIKVVHHITGKSTPDHKYNETEYNYASGAGNDPHHWGTRYHSWRKMR